jgi:hypothetical protein
MVPEAVSSLINMESKRKQEVLRRTNRLLALIRHGMHRKRCFHKNFIVACVFIAVVLFLPSRCVATVEEYLPGRCLATIRGCTYRHTD